MTRQPIQYWRDRLRFTDSGAGLIESSNEKFINEGICTWYRYEFNRIAGKIRKINEAAGLLMTNNNAKQD